MPNLTGFVPSPTAARALDALIGLPAPSSPGIYSRMERAVEAMPPMVPVQDLPGLIRKHREGVPGWEIQAVDLDSVVGDSKRVPRQDLLDAVRERSPVYTHKEVVLGGRPPQRPSNPDGSEGDYDLPHWMYQDSPSRIGEGVSHGRPVYERYGQGGEDYTEILLTQPGAHEHNFGQHWDNNTDAVAHARLDTHGDALRINEIQSDLANHNMKARTKGVSEDPWDMKAMSPEIPFPLEDSYRELLIKRLALEAARKGHRAIEIASPESISRSVGMPIEHAQHLYGKVIPSELERLGRKMGGLHEDTSFGPITAGTVRDPDYDRLLSEIADYDSQIHPSLLMGDVSMFGADIAAGDAVSARAGGSAIEENFLSAGMSRGGAAHEMARLASIAARRAEALDNAWGYGHRNIEKEVRRRAGRRYIMSDAMRRNIIQSGIGASVLGGLAAQDE